MGAEEAWEGAIRQFGDPEPVVDIETGRLFPLYRYAYISKPMAHEVGHQLGRGFETHPAHWPEVL